MPKIDFKPDNVSFEVATGSDLIEVAEENSTFLSFGCKSGMCGTCLITVVSGSESLPRPEPQESETLENMGATANHRLACQLKITEDIIISD